ncbi:Fucose permease [Geotoga petraea]|uniref:Fucose permease n=1 Tax=Geotoga petraea TaxID=28234 RepID=A0A1G6JF11_9BACT|nr:Fucose permease [Geotoga petraea]
MFIMVITSMIPNFIPPLMKYFQLNYDITISQSSALPLLNSAGAMFSNIFGGFLLSKIHFRKYFLFSYLLGIVGMFLFAYSKSFVLLSLSGFILGVSVSSTILVLTAIFTHFEDDLQNYGFFHGMFGFGGIISPIIIGFFLNRDFSPQYLLIFHAFIMAIIGFIVYKKAIFENKEYDPIHFSEIPNIMGKKMIIIPIIIFLLYAGTEKGIVTWSSNLFVDGFEYSQGFSAFLISLLWIFFTLARLITDTISKRIGEIKLVILTSFSALVSLIMLLSFQNWIFYIFLGLFLGPIFPALQKASNRNIPKREISLFSGIMYFSTGIGGIAVTYFMGLLGDYAIRAAYIIPIFTILIIAFLSRTLKKSG